MPEPASRTDPCSGFAQSRFDPISTVQSLPLPVARRPLQRLFERIMSQPATINPRIIDGLYCEALVLSDEVRGAFALSGRIDTAGQDEDLTRIALSCEALRTTTRMMHAMAWLLNHRAFFMGELSEFQLRRHGRLANDVAAGEPERLVLLSPEIRDLIATTERFYARLLRLDTSWRQRDPHAPSAVQRLRERLGQAVGQ